MFTALTHTHTHTHVHQMDLYHRFEEQGPKFERLLIDIEHLDLSELKIFGLGSVIIDSKCM